MSRPSNPNMTKRGDVPYVDFTIAAGGSSNEVDITVQFMDSDGKEVNDTFLFSAWVCNNPDGSDINDDATSAHSDGGSGELVGAFDDDADAQFLTDNTGECVMTITDTSKSANYVAVRDPRTGLTNVSRVLATADYT